MNSQLFHTMTCFLVESLKRVRIAVLITMSISAGAVAVSAPLSAQDIRGTVVNADSVTPVSGAIVLLLHASTDSIYARIVTGDRGLFNLRAPAATPVRMRVLRLGYQPTKVGTFTVSPRQTETVNVVLSERRVMLASFSVADTRRCDVRPDSARLVAQLYEEARKALLASTAVVSNTPDQAQFTLYTRIQDPRGKLLSPVSRNTFSGPSSKPFASLSADSLAKVGYVVEEKDGTAYRAPDANVLLADSFLRSHCLQLVLGTGERSASIGIGFKAVGRPRNKVDVKGTLWLERETNELEFLEYEYDGIPDDYTRAGVGGRVEYTQMSSGLWFASKWAIRMPHLTLRQSERLRGLRGGMTASVELSGLNIIGGEVQWIKVDVEVLYSNNGAALAGSEPRDLQNLRVTEGEFAVESGTQQVTAIRTALEIDSVFSRSSCADVATPGYSGQVRGTVKDLNRKIQEPVPVVAEWKEDFRMVGLRDIAWQFRRLETKSDAQGEYVLCGLPLARAVSLSALNGERKSRVGMVRFTERDKRTTMNLTIGDHIGSVFTAADAKIKGGVLFVVDPANVPLAYATVYLGGSTRATDRDGRLNLSMIPRDTLRLAVRKIGYSAFDGKVARDSANGAFRVMMAPVAQKLNTVVVNDRLGKSPLALTGFYDRMLESQRGAVVGEFFTPEDLVARPASQISDFLRASRYLQQKRGMWTTVLLGRGGCPAAVVIDGIRARGIFTNNSSWEIEDAQKKAGMIDVNAMVSMGEVAAIEVYPNAMLAPAALSSQVTNREGMCGVVGIWTGGRRK